MDVNDDEPEDVKKATSVEKEIKKGMRDDTFERQPRFEKQKEKWPYCISKKKNKSKVQGAADADCCQKKRDETNARKLKKITVIRHAASCTLTKLGIINREELSKEEHIDMLAIASRKCQPACFGRAVVERLRPVSDRIKELAKPTKHRLLMTLQDAAMKLPPAFLDNLIKNLEGDICLTPEQAEKAFRAKTRKVYRKSEKGRGKERKSKKSSTSRKQRLIGTSAFDKDSVTCQYLMAERFVKSILDWRSPIPKEEFRDISQVILRRLSYVLEYSIGGDEDRKSQQIRFLSDVIACWISGVLREVIDGRKKILEDESDRKRKEREEESMEKETEGWFAKDQDLDELPTDEEEEEIEGGEEGEEKKQQQQQQDEIEDEGEQQKQNNFVEEEEEVQQKQQEDDVEEESKREENGERSKGREEEDVEIKDMNAAEKVEEIKVIEKTEEQSKTELTEVAEYEMAAAKDVQMTEDEEEIRRRTKEEEESRRKAEEKQHLEAKRNEDEMHRQEQELEERSKGDEQLRRETTQSQQQTSIEAATETNAVGSTDEGMQTEGLKREIRQIQTDEDQEAAKRAAKVASDEKRRKTLAEEIRVEGPSASLEAIRNVSELFKTDVPFVTIAKIIEIVYKMVESTPENMGDDPLTNRLHRAIYDKLGTLISTESPELLTEKLKVVLNAVSGKIATWLRTILRNSQITLMHMYPPEVESGEIRSWSEWLIHVSDIAMEWDTWLRRAFVEAEKLRGAKISRGEWQEWTGTIDTGALQWRRFHLQTVHQARRNITMMSERKVVKTGTKIASSLKSIPQEKVMEATEL